jgi:hypothetical protein
MSTLGARLLFPLLLPLAACGGQLVEFRIATNPGDTSGDTAGDTASDTPPFVVHTDPLNDATEVAVGLPVSASFSEPMSPDTLNTGTFSVTDGTTSLTGVVTYDPATETATFTPDAPLAINTAYTATVDTGAEDAGGLAMSTDYSWTFTTTVEAEPPFVTMVTPINGSINVLIGAEPTATFSADMNPATLNDLTFTLRQGTTPIPGAVSYDAGTLTATFTPDAELDFELPYTGTITTGAEDTGGLAIVGDYVWTFTTEVNNIPPEVISNTPLAGATNVLIGVEPTATFSVDMNPATLNDLTFTLRQGTTPVPGAVSYDAGTLTATFTPDAELDFELLYTGTITIGAEDTGGLAIVANHVWTFTTEVNNIPPEVISNTPLNGAINVLVGAEPTATFSALSAHQK